MNELLVLINIGLFALGVSIFLLGGLGVILHWGNAFPTVIVGYALSVGSILMTNITVVS